MGGGLLLPHISRHTGIEMNAMAEKATPRIQSGDNITLRSAKGKAWGPEIARVRLASGSPTTPEIQGSPMQPIVGEIRDGRRAGAQDRDQGERP